MSVPCCNDDVLISAAKELQTDQQTPQTRQNQVGETVKYNHHDNKSENDYNSKEQMKHLRMKMCVILHWKFARRHIDQRGRQPRVLTSAPILPSTLRGCKEFEQQHKAESMTDE